MRIMEITSSVRAIIFTWGESISRGAVRSASSSLSGNTGLSFNTVVSIFTVETVTNNRKAVSTREHLLTG